MGAAYYIVLDHEIEGLDSMIDGKALSRHMESLDAAADQLGVRRLTEFFSIDPEEAAEFLSEVEDIKMPTLQQFSAEEGLATVRALLTRPEARPALQDLQECERVLKAAAEHGVKWHLAVDY